MTYLQTQVGVYRSFKYNGKIGYTLRKAVTLEEMLKDTTSVHLIRKYRQTRNQKIKEEIQLFTPAGYYADKRQEKEQMQAVTGLVQIDIDAKTNLWVEDWPGYRDYLFKTYKWIAVAGVSCSGLGLFLLVHTSDPEAYADHFYAIANELEDKEGLVIDRAVSSPNELRYMTLPEDIVFKANAVKYKDKAERPANAFTDLAVKAGTGKLVAASKDMKGKMRRQDVLDLIMANLHNGVDASEVIDYIADHLNFIDKTSMIYGDMDAITHLAKDLYRRYDDQFGQTLSHKAKLTSKSDVTVLDPIGEGKMSQYELWVLVISEVLRKYKIFVNESGIFQFDKTHWRKVTRPTMGQFLRNCAIEMGIPSNVATGHKFVEGMLKQLESDGYNDTIVARNDKLNFINGTLHFDDNKLYPHDAEDRLFYCLEFSYDAEAKCPKFETYLNYVLPDKDSQRTVLSYLGACFSDVKFEYMLCLLGDGGNGKSVLLDVLSGVLGPNNVCHVNMDNIAGFGSSSDNFRLMLENKIINVSSESRFKNIDFSVWKQLASHEPVIAHKFHRDRFEMRAYARTIYAMNSLPTNFEEHNEGFFRRLLIVPFKIKIPAYIKNINLAREIVNGEAAGVLNKIVEAINLFKSEGSVHRSKDSEQLVKDLETKNDSVQQFLDHVDATIDIVPTAAHPPLKDVYKSYRFYCEDELYVSPVGRTKFIDRLARLGVSCKKTGKSSDSVIRVSIKLNIK